MKKWQMVLTAALLLAALVFCGLWIYEKNDQSEMEALCQGNAMRALQSFEDYAATGSGAEYWYGVAEFYAFMNNRKALMDDADTEYLYCNIVYGYMILQPERVQENMPALLEAMQIIGTDYTHPNGYLRMSELGNLLKHG